MCEKNASTKAFDMRKAKEKLTKMFPKTYLLYQRYFRYSHYVPNCRLIEYPNSRYKVVDNRFWDEFESGWEPQTFRVFKHYLAPDVSYLDLGAFIGPTMLLAGACGCDKMVCVEANPLSFQQLKTNYRMNRKLLPPATFFNLCIYNKSGVDVTFGGRDYSAACMIGGSRWQIPSISLSDLLEKVGPFKHLFIKIDIEGAETRILSDMKRLADESNIAIYLSLHPPFWENVSKRTAEMLDILYRFDVYDYNLNKIPVDDMRHKLTSREPYPDWGTRYGNFFEIILEGKKGDSRWH